MKPSIARMTIVVAACVFASTTALAQPKKPKRPDAKPTDGKTEKAKLPANKQPKEQTFNFDGLGIQGKNRSPQLLYFLERANEELERATLERRSFIPRMVRTVEEEPL